MSQDEQRHDDRADQNWVTKAMHVTEQTMRGGRLDKPLAELTELQQTARRKVAALLPQSPSRPPQAPADLSEPPTPAQLADREAVARAKS